MVQLVVNRSLESVSYGFIPPIQDGLVLWSFIGGDALKSAKNHAPGGAVSSVVGAPVFAERYATLLPGSNYLQTQVSQTADATLIVIARPLADSNVYLAGNYNGPAVADPAQTVRGQHLALSADTAADAKTTLVFGQSIKDGSNVDQISAAYAGLAANVASFAMLVGRNTEATKKRLAKNFTTGISAETTAAFPSNLGSNKLRVGSVYANTGYTNPVDMAFCAAYSRSLSDAELVTLYAWAKAYYASRGIAI